jgi:hypothetical protein
MDGQLSSKVGRCEDAPGVGEREKVLFCQIPRHTHDDPRRKNPGYVAQRTRRDGGQTLLQTVGCHERCQWGLGNSGSKMRPRKHSWPPKEGNGHSNPFQCYYAILRKPCRSTLQSCPSSLTAHVFSHWKIAFATSATFDLFSLISCHAWLCATRAHHLTR